MNQNKKLKLMLAIVVLAIAGVIVLELSRYVLNIKKPLRNPPAESPVKSRNSDRVVHLGKSSQIKSGVVAARLETTSYREDLQAYGAVLQVNTLIEARKNHAAIQASVHRAEAALEASRKEYERLKALNSDNRNVSDKALQAAEAVWQADEANVRAATISLQAVEEAARLQWGSLMSGWLSDFAPGFKRLTAVKDVLVQVTLPPDKYIRSAPGIINVRSADGKLVPARLVARAPGTDPRIQGMSFLYLAPSSKTRLIPGMYVEAYMPAGPRLRGVFIPASAVVRRQGHTWVYVQEAAGRFVRRRIPVNNPVGNGYFATGFPAGTRVVVKGAQLLLSAEFLPARNEKED